MVETFTKAHSIDKSEVVGTESIQYHDHSPSCIVVAFPIMSAIYRSGDTKRFDQG